MNRTQQKKDYLKQSLSLLRDKFSNIPADKSVIHKVASPLRLEHAKGIVADAILKIMNDHNLQMLALLVNSCRSEVVKILNEYSEKYFKELKWVVIDEFGSVILKLNTNIATHNYLLSPLLDDLEESSESSDFYTKSKNYFSAINQNLLKIVIYHWRLFKNSTEQGYLSASELILKSNVSQASVSNFIRYSLEKNYLLKHKIHNLYKFNNNCLEDLLEDWSFYYKNNYGRAIRFIPYDTTYSIDTLLLKVKVLRDHNIRIVIGGFLALELQKLNYVSDIPDIRIYTDNIKYAKDGLDLIEFQSQDDVTSRKIIELVSPKAEASIFSHIMNKDIPICDIIQCYLDVRHKASRGIEQAEFIRKSVLL